MKKLFLILLVFVFCSGNFAFANDNTLTVKHQLMCYHFSIIAEYIMDLRQQGFEKEFLLEKFKLKNSEINMATLDLIELAFNVPFFEKHKHKQEAIDEFSNEIHQLCINQ